MPVKVLLRDNIQGIQMPAITRLARVAGIRSLSKEMLEELRGIIKVVLEKVIKNAVYITDYQRKNTVDITSVYYALPKFMYSIKPPAKTCPKYTTKTKGQKKKKAKPGMVAYREIKFYQKQSNCLYIPRLPFERLVREVAQDYKYDLKFSKDAMLLLQYYVESYVVKVLEESQLVALHKDQIRVSPKD